MRGCGDYALPFGNRGCDAIRLVHHRHLALDLGTHPENAFVLADGDVLEITGDEAYVACNVPADYVYVDGLGLGVDDIDQIVLRDRQHLASDGILVVVAAINRQRGTLAGVPEVMSHGFVGPDDEADMIEGVRRLVVDLFGGEGRQLDWTSMRERLKDEVASHLYKETHRDRPLVLLVTVEV